MHKLKIFSEIGYKYDSNLKYLRPITAAHLKKGLQTMRVASKYQEIFDINRMFHVKHLISNHVIPCSTQNTRKVLHKPLILTKYKFVSHIS